MIKASLSCFSRNCIQLNCGALCLSSFKHICTDGMHAVCNYPTSGRCKHHIFAGLRCEQRCIANACCVGNYNHLFLLHYVLAPLKLIATVVATTKPKMLAWLSGKCANQVSGAKLKFDRGGVQLLQTGLSSFYF